MPVALITGGDAGIGGACAAALSARGVEVAVLAPRAAPSADLSLTADMRGAAALRDAVAHTQSTLGPIEYLVTAAGHYADGDLAGLEDIAWRDMLSAHVTATANAWRAVLPGMRERRRGAICALGGEAGVVGDAGAPHYAAATGAIHGMVKSLAVEVAPEGIRVNCVSPGPLARAPGEDGPTAGAGGASLPAAPRPSAAQIAAAVCFVLLEDTNLLGQVLAPTAGM